MKRKKFNLFENDGNQSVSLNSEKKLKKTIEEIESKIKDMKEELKKYRRKKRVLQECEIKLKKTIEEMESKLKDIQEVLKKCHRKECIRIFKHMESLEGDFSEYINNADEDDIEHIVSCCELFKKGEYKYTGDKKKLSKCIGEERKSDLMFLSLIKKEF